MQSTKDLIIQKAKILFSKHGIPNVRLQQIADEAGISIGNLAYHFNNKEAIVKQVYQDALKELSDIILDSQNDLSLVHFDDKFSRFYHFMKKNIFYFNNYWEIMRNYSVINKQIKALNRKILCKIESWIEDNVKSETIKKEEFENAHKLLAKSLLFSLRFWLSSQLLLGKPPTEADFKIHVWSIYYPHITEKGKRLLSKYFHQA